ncbi:AAA family ATPase [Aliivibrio fischeri]|uniref:AAA family ATPase n=1 Tax=Aliivibrio fischeri TaxID=668 RepID=UPI0007C54D99|nr:AAA family ATPase [Aliivibrio fischeri]MBP3139225.1 AAA family ATPase [Aliivibrio fischeri]
MATSKIYDLLNNQSKPEWWKHAFRLASKNGELSNTDLESLYKVAKQEVNILQRDQYYIDNTKPVIPVALQSEISSVHLLEINNVVNVGALAGEQSLKLEESGITAIYGENGSGKSSYSKILKNACVTRGNVPDISTNIFSPKTEKPSAEIILKVGEQLPETVNWTYQGEDNDSLKLIRVFDSTSSNHYVSKVDTVVFKHSEINILNELQRACDYIKANYLKDADLKEEVITLPVCKEGTKAQIFINSLTANSTVTQLDDVCLTSEQIEQIESLKAQVLRLKVKTASELRKEYKSNYTRLTPLKRYLQSLSNLLSEDAIKDYKKLYDDCLVKSATAEQIRASILDGHPIEAIGSSAWQSMWKYTKAFIENNGQDKTFPPVEGDFCPTCLQTVSADSATKMKSFDDFLKEQTQKDAEEATKKLNTARDLINKLTFSLTNYEDVLTFIKLKNEDVEQCIQVAITSLKIIADNLNKQNPEFTDEYINFSFIDWLTESIEEYKRLEADVSSDEKLSETIAKLEIQIVDLEESKKVTDNRENILKQIANLVKKQQKIALLSKCEGRSLTMLSKDIANSGALGNLNSKFQEELAKLGFKAFDVSTVTKGQQGVQKLKLEINGKSNTIDTIASEGEQKCISLAGFLAELSVDESHSAIIFDDPVNSLDHKWRDKFAKRIAEESLQRQVIVLTHDLPFLKNIEERAVQLGATLKTIAVKKRGQRAGIPSEQPPWAAQGTKARIGVLKQYLQQVGKAWRDDDEEKYKQNAGMLYSYKREAWERLVEEWLLGGVVERFGRGVETNRLKKLKDDITTEDVNIVVSAMTKCSTHMIGHDGARDMDGEFPDFDELSTDIDELEKFYKSLTQRRK